VRAGLVCVVALSFAYSLWFTGHDPAGAYFVTPTRVWELGAGGVLAAFARAPRQPGLLVGRSRTLRSAGAAIGLLGIAWSAVTFTGSTPFPGWRAAIPVAGAVLVMASGDLAQRTSVVSFLRIRPVQRLGDLSYSVYLWHWPLVILVPYVSGGSLGRLDKAVILVASWLLAEVTKRFIEDPFRRPRSPRLLVPYVAAALGMALVAGMATLQLVEVAHREHVDELRLAAAIKAGGRCFGAPALDDGADCTTAPRTALFPTPAQAVRDRYDVKHELKKTARCWASAPAFVVRTCEFGDPHGKVDVAVVGNSHAAQWLAPLEQIAGQRGWRITTFVAHECALADTAQAFDTAEASQGCADWQRQTTARISHGPFGVVLVSNRMSVLPFGETRTSGRASYARGYHRVLDTWRRSGKTVIAIADTPRPNAAIGYVPTCLEKHRADFDACSGTRDAWVPDDPVEDVVKDLDDPKVRSIDLNDHVCRQAVCPAVVGGVIVYSDNSHLTTTYALTLRPYLDRELTAALRATG
jgi:hypothetical protein